MIRPAAFGDIPRLAELLGEMHARSVYAGRAELDVREAKALMLRSIQRHGGRRAGSTLVMVAATDGVVHGFLLGLLDRVYHVLGALLATDVFFYVDGHGDPRDARRLLRALMAWADTNPAVIEVRMGATGAIGDWRRTEKLYQRAGMHQAGVIYERRIAR